MSWTMWHVTGSGLDIAKADEEHLQNFLTNHLAVLTEESERLDEKEERNDIRPVIDWIYAHPLWPVSAEKLQELTQSGTAAEPVAFIMSVETGLTFYYPGVTEDGEDCVLFCACNPWEMNEAERKLTSFEDLKKIMEPYAKELGLEFESDVDLIYAG